MAEAEVVRSVFIDGQSYERLPDGTLVPLVGKTDLARQAAMTEAEIEADAENDPDAPPMTDEEWEQGTLQVPVSLRSPKRPPRGPEKVRARPRSRGDRSAVADERIRNVAVFCGSRLGANPAHQSAAHELGTGLGQRGIHLVYGGAEIGFQGVVARAALAAGGEVTGVIPAFLEELEKPLATVTRTIITRDMHDRKWRMYELADAFVILPGGMGTFDETFEVITWRQLMRHDAPIIICNIGGWAVHLIGLIDNAIEQGFASPSARDGLYVADTVSWTLQLLESLSRGRILAEAA